MATLRWFQRGLTVLVTSVMVCSLLPLATAPERAWAQTAVSYHLKFDLSADLDATDSTTIEVWLNGTSLGTFSAGRPWSWEAKSKDITNIFDPSKPELHKITWTYRSGMDTGHVRRLRIESSDGRTWGDQYFKDYYASQPYAHLGVAYQGGNPARMLDHTIGVYYVVNGRPTHWIGVGIPGWQSWGMVGIDAIDPTGMQGDPVNSLTGAFETSVTDLSLPGIGMAFELTRSYTSARSEVNYLGKGWFHSYEMRLDVSDPASVQLTAESGQRVLYRRAPSGIFEGPAGGHSKLVAVAEGYELQRIDQTVFTFDSSGRLTKVKDANGNQITLNYTNGQLATVTDTVGRTITFTYANGRLSKVRLPDGRFVSYGYTNYTLTSVTDVRGGVTKYAYDAQTLLTKVTDQNDHVVIENIYGADGRVSEQIDGRSKHTWFSWDPVTQTSTMKDARQNEWKDVYDKGVLVKRIDPLGNTTEFGRDPALNLGTVTDPRGFKMSMTYDARGNMLTRSAPSTLGYQPEVWTYTSQNNVDTYTDRLGRVTDYDYNAAGNLIKVTRPGSAVTETPRLANGLVDKVIDPRLKVTELGYDTVGNLTEVITPEGRKTTFGYDASGRKTTMVEARGNKAGNDPLEYDWEYTYDAANHVTSAEDPLDNKTEWSYDPGGNLDWMKDAKFRTTDYGYDLANHLTSVDPPGSTPATTYGYDDVGNLAWRADANNSTKPETEQKRTLYAYDNANRLEKVTTPLGKVWDYTYWPTGELKTVEDANYNANRTGSGIVSYDYDELGRLKSIDYPTGTSDVAFTYHANDLVHTMTDGLGTETYSYTARDQLDTVTRATDVFDYDYNEVDAVTKRTYPDGTVVDYTYTDDGHMDTVTSAGQVTDYHYNEAGLLDVTTLPTSNGHVETLGYDRAGRVTNMITKKGTTTLSSFDYVLDATGNPTQVTDDTGAVTTYGYDDLDQLKEACYQAGPCTGATDPFIRYDYDNVGNRLSEARPTGTTTYEYNAGDQLLTETDSSGATNYGHDANGNMIQAGSKTYGYDHADRMSTATVGSTTTNYTYDGEGKRTKASWGPNDADKINYAWDVAFGLPEPIRESDGGGALLRKYVHGLDTISMKEALDTYYFHTDRIGSVTEVTDSAGVKQWDYTYEPFGEEKVTTEASVGPPTNPMRFAGEYLDDTGLYHLRARQYDPGLGRFTAIDPWTPPVMQPGPSPFGYVNNRPTFFTDPSGMVPWSASSADICDFTNSGLKFLGNEGKYYLCEEGPSGEDLLEAYIAEILKQVGGQTLDGEDIIQGVKGGCKWVVAGAPIIGAGIGGAFGGPAGAATGFTGGQWAAAAGPVICGVSGAAAQKVFGPDSDD